MFMATFSKCQEQWFRAMHEYWYKNGFCELNLNRKFRNLASSSTQISRIKKTVLIYVKFLN